MRVNKRVGAVVVASAFVVVLSCAPAKAMAAPALAWKSPAKVTTGVPFSVASITPCPPAPTPADTVLVQISLSLGSGGSANNVLTAQPNGSWSGSLTFVFSGVTIRHTTISATCLDFSGHTAVPYAQYRQRHTQIFT